MAHTPVLSFPICGAMLAIWHLRPSLQRRFPLHHHLAKDWWGLFAWCVSDGRKDYASLREIPDLEDYLGREVKLPQIEGDAWEGQISLGILCGGMARNRWTLGGLLNSVLARKRAARGFWRGERHARSLPTGRPRPTSASRQWIRFSPWFASQAPKRFRQFQTTGVISAAPRLSS